MRCIQKGDVAEVVGADIDPVVLTNPKSIRQLSSRMADYRFSDQSFDLAFSDYLLSRASPTSGW